MIPCTLTGAGYRSAGTSERKTIVGYFANPVAMTLGILHLLSFISPRFVGTIST